ncbi:MAG: hypothetical protein ABSH50_22985 [Bryobacteraceae bacterium]|jgi:hypothetical protein
MPDGTRAKMSVDAWQAGNAIGSRCFGYKTHTYIQMEPKVGVIVLSWSRFAGTYRSPIGGKAAVVEMNHRFVTFDPSAPYPEHPVRPGSSYAYRVADHRLTSPPGWRPRPAPAAPAPQAARG